MTRMSSTTGIDINWLLEYLAQQWAEVTVAAVSWDAWDQETRLDYLNEWPITVSYGEVLDDEAARGALSIDQSRRYRELLNLIDAARPTIDDLLERGLGDRLLAVESPEA